MRKDGERTHTKREEWGEEWSGEERVSRERERESKEWRE